MLRAAASLCLFGFLCILFWVGHPLESMSFITQWRGLVNSCEEYGNEERERKYVGNGN